MMRQVHEMAAVGHGINGRLVSLNPVRSDNMADPWETASLQAFAEGDEDASIITTLNGVDVIRLIKPFYTEKKCLACHANQGFKIGEVYGGISAALPLGTYQTHILSTRFYLGTAHVSVWILGVLGIYWADKKQTKQAEMKEEISRLDYLNLIGELAGSIGHEIRNPLTTVRGYLQLLCNDKNKDQPVFNTMIEELDRANEIITEFLSISKHKRYELSETDLNTIIKKTFPLIEAKALMDNKTIQLDLCQIPTFKMNANQIQQLILNLVSNGLDATSPGGKVTISTYRESNEVAFSVRDNGSGIPPEHWVKIGQPFFTTKNAGTGLGLSVCYTIARKHNAKINFVSSTNGTEFIVRFKI